MRLSPRVALCAAFTLASLAGAGFVARVAASPRPAEVHIEDMFLPDAESEGRVHRVALRQETIADLMNEELTLETAAERFWDLSTGTEESLASLRTLIPGGSDEEKVVTQVLLFARIHASLNEARYAPRLARLKAEAASFHFKPVTLQ